MPLSIKVDNLSKAYQIGQFNTGALSHDIERWWALLRGKQDPFLKIGETNDRSIKGNSNVVWSLKDVDLEVEKGDAFGIIGKNGAGKSTLLKVLSRVTAPTKGEIKIKGRVASLLEVGTGFHPELTGRENIFLNGAILGMRKHEIRSRFDEIVDFSSVERYIDTPVKRYSSGMYVRLAFAVAAHLHSEVLIVDEVLAVGDADFQKKCVGKMGDISKGEGRTILFVSHNLGMVKALCKKAIVLKNGSKDFDGSVEESIRIYNSGSISLNDDKSENHFSVKKDSDCYFVSCRLSDESGVLRSKYDVFDKIFIEIEYVMEKPLKAMNLAWVLSKAGEQMAVSFDTDFHPELLEEREAGTHKVRSQLPYPPQVRPLFNFTKYGHYQSRVVSY